MKDDLPPPQYLSEKEMFEMSVTVLMEIQELLRKKVLDAHMTGVKIDEDFITIFTKITRYIWKYGDWERAQQVGVDPAFQTFMNKLEESHRDPDA